MSNGRVLFLSLIFRILSLVIIVSRDNLPGLSSQALARFYHYENGADWTRYGPSRVRYGPPRAAGLGRAGKGSDMSFFPVQIVFTAVLQEQ